MCLVIPRSIDHHVCSPAVGQLIINPVPTVFIICLNVSLSVLSNIMTLYLGC